MKRVIFGLAMLLVSALTLAQGIRVTEFLGVPVDGSLEVFEKRMEKKGFEYKVRRQGLKVSVLETYMTGMFAGAKMMALPVVNDDSVLCRMWLVENKTFNAKGAKEEFNRLVRFFANDSTHYFTPEDYTIADDVDLAKMMKQHPDTIIGAAFFQYDREEENDIIQQTMQECEMSDGFHAMSAEQQASVKAMMRETLAENFAAATSMRSVWLKIYKERNEYAIFIFFDNLYNLTWE